MVVFLYYIFLVSVVVVGVTITNFGGKFAKLGDFPYTAIIFYENEIYCSGLLVSLSKVVTAAHCLRFIEDGKNTDIVLKYMTVGAGLVDIVQPTEEYEKRFVKSFSVYTEYGPEARWHKHLDTHNVGVLVLNEPFIEGKYIQTAKLISTNPLEFQIMWKALVDKGTTCQAIGFGTVLSNISDTSNEFAIEPGKMKVFKAKPKTDNACKSYFPPGEDMTWFGEVCVDPVNINTEKLCNGDPGSPLVCDGYVYALLSFSSKCSSRNLPQIYILFWNYIKYFGLSNDAPSLDPKWLTYFLILFPVINKNI